jgi:excisionase family DNA binding protein
MTTVSNLAKRMGVTPAAVRLWIRAGKVRVVTTLGGHYRIPEEEVARLCSTPQR